MSARKTSIDRNIVQNFLVKNFDEGVSRLQLLDSGEMSCPYSFSVGKKDYVIRIDEYFQAYEKDKYAFEHFILCNFMNTF